MHAGGVRPQYEPWASSAAARATMQGNRRRDTKPELAVRRAVHALGFRYRVDERPLPDLNRRADLVFPRAKVAVFVDGCYWHGCPEHGTTVKTNAAYWAPKIRRNRDRDADTDARLAEAGWTVVRIWEHEDPALAAKTIATAVAASSPHTES
jgi:DNA mismatch endonuclease (patch repair protein)